MQRPKFILIDIVLSSSCVMEKQELFLILIALFHFICLGVFFFTKHSKTVSYFVFLILFIAILPLFETILIKIQFFHFISRNISNLLSLQITNLDCNKILMSISRLYHLISSCVKNNGQ